MSIAMETIMLNKEQDEVYQRINFIIVCDNDTF